MIWARRGIERLNSCNNKRQNTGGNGGHNSVRQVMIVIFSLMLGIQLGYKLASKQLIYMLSPCHVVTALQIYLMAARPTPATGTLFRVHIGLLNGALLALLFPVLDTYKFPFEIELYWLQHSLMLAVPYLMFTQGHPYTPEPANMFHHAILSYSLFFLVHLLLLQPIAILTGINLDFILCPAPSDPFAGPNYLLHASWTQFVVIISLAKVYSLTLLAVQKKGGECTNEKLDSEKLEECVNGAAKKDQ